MRAHFKNLGQANLYLKTCKKVLDGYLRLPAEIRLPSQRIRNAFCRGFGYSSYDELRRLLSGVRQPVTSLPTEEALLSCITKGFSLAFDVASECGAQLNPVDQFMTETLARSAFDEMNREGAGRGLYSQSPSECAEGLVDAGWEILLSAGPLGKPSLNLLSEAKPEFRAAIEADPDTADAYNGLAYIEFTRGNYEGSLHHAEAALEKARINLQTDDPGAYTWWGELRTRPYMRARHTLGISLMRLGRYVAAAAEFRALLSRNQHDNQGVRFLLGPTYHLAGNLRSALPAYRKSAANNKYSGDPHNEFSYALALYERREYENAVLRYRYATFTNIHIPQVLLGLPLNRLDIFYGSNTAEPNYATDYLNEYRGLWEGKTDALAFLRAVYFHPTVQEEIAAYIKHLRSLARTENVGVRIPFAEAVSKLKSIERLTANNHPIADDVSPRKSSARAKRSTLSQAVGSRDEEYRSQINSTVAGRRALKVFFGKGSDKMAAIPELGIVLGIHPDNLLARAMRAECRVFSNSELEEAAEDCRGVLSVEPDRERILYVLGRALILLKKYEEAIDPLEKARKLAPDNTQTLINLGLALGAGRRDYARGLRHARRATRLEPDNPKAHFMVMNLLQNSGRDEELSRYTMRLMDYNPELLYAIRRM